MKSYQNLLKAKRNYAKYVSESHLSDNAVAENSFDCSRRSCSIWKKIDSIDQLERLLSITSTITTIAESN